MKKHVIGRLLRYRGKWVRIREEATGFVSGSKRYWVRAIEPVAGYKPGEEFTVTDRHVRRQIRRNG